MRTILHTCQEDQSVERCAQIMRDRNIGFVPVLGVDGGLRGVVTDRDLTTRILAEGRSGDTPVCAVMTPNPLVCNVDDDLVLAEQRLCRTERSRIVVVEDDGCCVGIISLADIAQVEDPLRAGELFRRILRREAKTSSGAML